jgi:hypothetical protein
MRLNRLQIAETQLERALELYLERQDSLSAATLASAAEQILSRLLDRHGPAAPPAAPLDGPRTLSHRLNRYFRRKELVEFAEGLRSGLEQPEGDDELGFDPDEAARDILDRAITSYATLTGRTSGRMLRFQSLLIEQPPD